MNNALPPVTATRTSSGPGPALYSDHMLAEWVTLQEEMIAQLRAERLRVTDTADFLTGMIDHFLSGVIDQHEKAAVILLAQLGSYPADTTNDGLIVITREDRSDAEASPVPRFA